jgi:hypothetical protein
MPFPEKTPVVLEDEASPPFKSNIQALQELVAALEKGNYEAQNVGLVSGQPLKIESLEPVMRCVTYGDPECYRRWEARCLRLAKVFRFFRMNNWASMIVDAAIHFEAQKKRYTIILRKNRHEAKSS